MLLPALSIVSEVSSSLALYFVELVCSQFSKLVLFVIGFSFSLGKARSIHRELGKDENVVTLPSGLQYKVIERGKGTAHPTRKHVISFSFLSLFN